jgi:hypothetical protein
MTEPPVLTFSTTERLEQYKAYLSDLGNIGSRHETARGFYLSVLSALLSFLALTGDKGPLKSVSSAYVIVVGIAGVAISVLWIVHTLTFASLYRAKFGKLGEMEVGLPYQTFGVAHASHMQDKNYNPLTYVECCVAMVFVFLYVWTMGLAMCDCL